MRPQVSRIIISIIVFFFVFGVGAYIRYVYPGHELPVEPPPIELPPPPLVVPPNFFSSPPPPVAPPPPIAPPPPQTNTPTVSLAVVAGELENNLSFSVFPFGSATIQKLILAKSRNSNLVNGLDAAGFNNPHPANAVELISLPLISIGYTDKAVSDGVREYYKLMACDNAIPTRCGFSPLRGGIAKSLILNVTLGTEQIIFDPPADACNGDDITDEQPRAVRLSDGTIRLISGHYVNNYALVGPDFDHLKRFCKQEPFHSNENLDPAAFDYQNWLGAVYRDPDSTTPNRIYALFHDEYHDYYPQHSPPCAGAQGGYNPCWYNAINYGYSDNGGVTFTVPPAPQRLVAALPYPWNPYISGGTIVPQPYGYFGPSNILKKDGYYYTFFGATLDPNNQSTNGLTCLMRTNNLADPQSWRIWDGAGFNQVARNPYGSNAVSYQTAISNPSAYFCSDVDQNLRGLAGSVTFNTYLQKYIAVGTLGNGTTVPCGFYYTLSNDLLHWSKPQQLRLGNLPWCVPGTPADIYPAFIDQTDTSVNFENTSNQFYLYFVRWIQGMDRDLIRVPVTILK